MKKFIVLFLAIFFAVISNAKVLINNIAYNLNFEERTAEVTSSWEIGPNLNYKGNIVIPESVEYEGVDYIVTRIGSYAFGEFASTESVSIPGTVTSIGDGAFSRNIGLKSITIPSSVTNMGRSLFTYCVNLKSIIVEKGNTAYDSRNNCNAIIKTDENILISGCAETIIPNSVTSIGEYAFCGLETNSITIPNSVTSIGEYAFYACGSILSITVGSNVLKIGNCAFDYCNSLKDIYFLGDRSPECYDFYQAMVLHVKDYAVESFKNTEPWNKFKIVCDELITDFELHYYVNGAVYKTEKHKYSEEIIPVEAPKKKGMNFDRWINLPDTMPGLNIDVIASYSWCKQSINKAVYMVGDTIMDYAHVIGNDNANGTVTIADAVEFDGVSYKVTKIADNAFNGCNTITRFDISKNVTKIGEKAFANINKLNDVYCCAEEVPETDRTAFENSYIDYVTLHVPAGSIDKYKTVGPWKNFKDVVAINNQAPVCETPTINYDGEQILFECETEQVSFVYDIEAEDAIGGEGDKTTLGGVYNVSVYATKKGYTKSKTATKKITVKPKRGDLNGDGKVNAADHVTLSNIIMNQVEEE